MNVGVALAFIGVVIVLGFINGFTSARFGLMVVVTVVTLWAIFWPRRF